MELFFIMKIPDKDTTVSEKNHRSMTSYQANRPIGSVTVVKVLKKKYTIKPRS